jgi:glutamine amidotransferase-like uncharacterized protein
VSCCKSFVVSACFAALLFSPFCTRNAALADKTASMTSIRVAIFGDKGATESDIKRIEKTLTKMQGFDVKTINVAQIRAGSLKSFDVVIHPGGSASAQSKALGDDGRAAVKKFVNDSGGFVGICAGAYLASSQYDWSLHLLKARVIDGAHWARGEGSVQLRLSSAGKSALHSEKETCSIHFENGPLLGPMKGGDDKAFESLATFDTEIATNGASPGVMKGTTAIARGAYGKGRVICFSPHPEKTPGRESILQQAVRWAAGRSMKPELTDPENSPHSQPQRGASQ